MSRSLTNATKHFVYGLQYFMLSPPACRTYRRRRAACPREGTTVRTGYAYQPRACRTYRVPCGAPQVIFHAVRFMHPATSALVALLIARGWRRQWYLIEQLAERFELRDAVSTAFG
eukprot:scaffold24434_cov54-Phaeocystis_antarctica.AAC.1